MNQINVVLTINDYYTKYLAVTITSIIANTNEKIKFFILDGGISNKNKQKIRKISKNFTLDINYIKIDKQKFVNMPSSSQAHISNETNYRFIISTLFPSMNKCIFIDADLVFINDVKKLWDIDIDNYYMAAVADQAPLTSYNWTRNFPFEKNYRYVNTGVTLINLDKWRKENIEEKLFLNVGKYAPILKFPDQDTLNITLQKKIKYIPHTYNAMPVQKYVKNEELIEAFSDPIVIHWAGYEKPWIYPDANYAEYFWEYARLTPFYEEIIYQNAEKFREQNKLVEYQLYNNFWQRVFSIKNDKRRSGKIYKVVTILGLRLKFRKKEK